MAALELLVAGHAGVGHPPVDRRHHLDPARPILGCQRPLDPGMMNVGHAHEPSAAQRRLTAAAIPEAQLSDHRRVADIELVAIGEQVDIGEPDRLLALDPQLEDQPVGQVHQILVEHRQSPENRRLAVVNPVPVRARVVHAVGILPLRGPTRTHVAVARRGQRLPKPLRRRLEPFIRQRERRSPYPLPSPRTPSNPEVAVTIDRCQCGDDRHAERGHVVAGRHEQPRWVRERPSPTSSSGSTWPCGEITGAAPLVQPPRDGTARRARRQGGPSRPSDAGSATAIRL